MACTHNELPADDAAPSSDEVCRLRTELNMLRERHTALVQRQRSEGDCCSCADKEAEAEKQQQELRRDLAFESIQRHEAESLLDTATERAEATVQQEKAALEQRADRACAGEAATREELAVLQVQHVQLQKDHETLREQMSAIHETAASLKKEVQRSEQCKQELEQCTAALQGTVGLLTEQLASNEESKTQMLEEHNLLQVQKVELESELFRLRAAAEDDAEHEAVLLLVQQEQQKQIEALHEEQNDFMYREQLRRTRERTEQALATTACADVARTKAARESLENTLGQLQDELEQERKARRVGQSELEVIMLKVAERFGDNTASELKAAVDVQMGLQAGHQLQQWMTEFSSNRRSKSELIKEDGESNTDSSPLQRLETRCKKKNSDLDGMQFQGCQTREDESCIPCEKAEIAEDFAGLNLSPLQKRAQRAHMSQ